MINLNTNTAFRCISHILGNLQFLQTVAELCADVHYYFGHSFNSPWGSRASSICPVRYALTPWATRVEHNCFLWLRILAWSVPNILKSLIVQSNPQVHISIQIWSDSTKSGNIFGTLYGHSPIHMSIYVPRFGADSNPIFGTFYGLLARLTHPYKYPNLVQILTVFPTNILTWRRPL